MKLHSVFCNKLGCCSVDEVFSSLVEGMKDSINRWDYFVNWSKAIKGAEEVEISVNLLNYLIGKEDVRGEAVKLMELYPVLIRTVPVLLACRENKFHMLKQFENGNFVYEDYNFALEGSASAEKAVEFLENTGFLELLRSKRIKSLFDYVFGIEVGLDSNGRKNRGGAVMEGIVEYFIKQAATNHGVDYIKQATHLKIMEKWGITVKPDKSSRRFDFAVNAKGKLFLIETNFYGGGGSKLKATAGEYKSLNSWLRLEGHSLIWITDGAGWRNTQRPLREAFDEIDYVLNLKMLEKEMLQEILFE